MIKKKCQNSCPFISYNPDEGLVFCSLGQFDPLFLEEWIKGISCFVSLKKDTKLARTNGIGETEEFQVQWFSLLSLTASLKFDSEGYISQDLNRFKFWELLREDPTLCLEWKEIKMVKDFSEMTIAELQEEVKRLRASRASAPRKLSKNKEKAAIPNSLVGVDLSALLAQAKEDGLLQEDK